MEGVTGALGGVTVVGVLGGRVVGGVFGGVLGGRVTGALGGVAVVGVLGWRVVGGVVGVIGGLVVGIGARVVVVAESSSPTAPMLPPGTVVIATPPPEPPLLEPVFPVFPEPPVLPSVEPPPLLPEPPPLLPDEPEEPDDEAPGVASGDEPDEALDPPEFTSSTVSLVSVRPSESSSGASDSIDGELSLSGIPPLVRSGALSRTRTNEPAPTRHATAAALTARRT